jgi:hypothetical protein
VLVTITQNNLSSLPRAPEADETYLGHETRPATSRASCARVLAGYDESLDSAGQGFMKPNSGFEVQEFSDPLPHFDPRLLELGKDTFAARRRFPGSRATSDELGLHFTGVLQAARHRQPDSFGPRFGGAGFCFEFSFYVFSFGFGRLFRQMSRD